MTAYLAYRSHPVAILCCIFSHGSILSPWVLSHGSFPKFGCFPHLPVCIRTLLSSQRGLSADLWLSLRAAFLLLGLGPVNCGYIGLQDFC